jgi:hypothetical protein
MMNTWYCYSHKPANDLSFNKIYLVVIHVYNVKSANSIQECNIGVYILNFVRKETVQHSSTMLDCLPQIASIKMRTLLLQQESNLIELINVFRTCCLLFGGTAMKHKSISRWIVDKNKKILSVQLNTVQLYLSVNYTIHLNNWSYR